MTLFDVHLPSLLTALPAALGFLLLTSLCALYRLLQRPAAPTGRPHPINDIIRAPPCLTSLPVLGSLPFLPWRAEELHTFLTNKARQLGPVFAFQAGPRSVALTLQMSGLDPAGQWP